MTKVWYILKNLDPTIRKELNLGSWNGKQNIDVAKKDDSSSEGEM